MEDINRENIGSFSALPLEELVSLSNRARREHAGKKLELCNIMNAKSGSCAEDCKFCAQSSRHNTGADSYPLKSKKEMLDLARRAKEIGAHRFDIVTSGDNLTFEEIKIIADAVHEITAKVGIEMCASLGTIDERGFALLKGAGLTRYHHNLETSPRYFPQIVTTHTFAQRVNTVKSAKKAGLEVCSGGIIGMGEDLEDRIELAFWLKELDVDSVPINILVPIKGTPLGERIPLAPEEALRAIALFRIILKNKIIKIAAGREAVFGRAQASAFAAGANGMLIGGYLTIKGQGLEQDRMLIKEIRELWA